MPERIDFTPEKIGDATDELFWRSHEKWVRAAIGTETGRDGSEVSDYELLNRYNEGGFAEWDPRVAQAVRDYFQSIGVFDLRA